MTTKLNHGQLHILRLIAKEQSNDDGYAPVSARVYPLLKTMPSELVYLHPPGPDGRGCARLTYEGQSLLAAMELL